MSAESLRPQRKISGYGTPEEFSKGSHENWRYEVVEKSDEDVQNIRTAENVITSFMSSHGYPAIKQDTSLDVMRDIILVRDEVKPHTLNDGRVIISQEDRADRSEFVHKIVHELFHRISRSELHITKSNPRRKLPWAQRFLRTISNKPPVDTRDAIHVTGVHSFHIKMDAEAKGFNEWTFDGLNEGITEFLARMSMRLNQELLRGADLEEKGEKLGAYEREVFVVNEIIEALAHDKSMDTIREVLHAYTAGASLQFLRAIEDTFGTGSLRVLSKMSPSIFRLSPDQKHKDPFVRYFSPNTTPDARERMRTIMLDPKWRPYDEVSEG